MRVPRRGFENRSADRTIVRTPLKTQERTMRNKPRLFSSGDLQSLLDQKLKEIKGIIERIPKEQFLGVPIESLVEHTKQSLVISPLALIEDQMRVDTKEIRVDVTGRFEYDFGDGDRVVTDGYQVTFFIPFSGDPGLWRMRPGIWFSSEPNGEIDDQNRLLKIICAYPGNAGAEKYKGDLESSINQIRRLIESQKKLIDQYHEKLPTAIKECISNRRTRIEKLHGITAALNIPLIKKEGMPEFKPIELNKRIPFPLPKVPKESLSPEPAISDEIYDLLLSIIRHAGASFEGNPQTFLTLGEEGLRDNVLSHINVVFEGKATGETFRKYGKTDIRIEEESRSAFVAECKLWSGEKNLLDALTQLLGYLTWRDCKAALIIFNKDVAGFTTVQNKISSALREHPNFIKEVKNQFSGEWRFSYQSLEDQAREVHIHTFAFNLFVNPDHYCPVRYTSGSVRPLLGLG